jgi:MFS superfamily sulfate permease-like transporter
MNTLIYYAFNVFVLSLIVLGVGLFKPKWILLWMDKPTRLPVVMIAAVLFMISAVMFGEGNKQMQLEKAQVSKQQSLQNPVEEVPDLH